MVTCLKRLKRAVMTFILVFSILLQSFYFNPEEVKAAVPDVTAFINYFLSTSGACLSNGESISSAYNRLSDNYKQSLADAIGSGIYEDSSGNYVFSPSVTQAFYDALNNNSNVDCRVVSNFNEYSGGNPTFKALVKSKLGSNNNGYSNYLLAYGSNSSRNMIKCFIFDMSNVAYITVNSKNSFQFYNTNGGQISVNCIRVYQTGSVSSFSPTGLGGCTWGQRVDYDSYTLPIEDTVINDFTSLDQFYNNFPFNNLVFCNKSLIVAKNVSSGSSYVNNNNRIFVSNTYNTFPKVSKTVMENNNWSSIYNNYVNRVKNEKNYYTTNNNTIDTSKLQEVISRYGEQITQAVEDGNEDIQEVINVTNSWLQRIYTLLDEINSQLGNSGGSGGDTVSGSTVDLSNIESYLLSLNTSVSAMQSQITYIANNLPNDQQQLQAIYTVLTNIYQSLQNIPSPGSPIDPNSDPYAPWYPKFFGIPDTDIIDTVEKIEIIEALLSGLVPLCYITGLGAVVNALGTQPVDPVFNIPLEFHNDIIDVDEDIEIDLTPFEDIRDIVAGGIVLCFMLALGYFTIWLLKFLLDILSKY